MNVCFNFSEHLTLRVSSFQTLQESKKIPQFVLTLLLVRLKDISTLDFSTPSFNPGPFNPRFSTMNFLTPWLKNSWLKSPGLKSSWLKSSWLKSLGLKLGVEKFGVEMSFNHLSYFLKILCYLRFLEVPCVLLKFWLIDELYVKLEYYLPITLWKK